MVIGEWGIGEIINNPILQKKQDQKIVSDPAFNFRYVL
jgi:hypothetical protein